MYQKTTLKLSSSKTVELFLPEAAALSTQILYVLDGPKLIPEILSFLEHITDTILPILVSLPDEDRLNDYTPWPAPALSERFADFGGNGEHFIAWITSEVMPAVEAAVFKDISTSSRSSDSILLGYSLGGLLAVYTSFIDDTFSKIISISGSFWYLGWDMFIQKHRPLNPETKYLMLYGSKEGSGKQSLQKDAVIRSKFTYKTLCSYTNKFPVFVDNGGHHNHLDERIGKAMQWILQYNYEKEVPATP